MRKPNIKPLSAMLLLLFLLSMCTAGVAAFTIPPYATITRSVCGGVEYTSLAYTVPHSVATIETIAYNFGFNSTSVVACESYAEQNGTLIFSPLGPSTALSVNYSATSIIDEPLNVGVNTIVLTVIVDGTTVTSTLRITRLPLESARSSTNADEAPPEPAFQELPTLAAGPVFAEPHESSAQLGEIAAGETVSLLQWTFDEAWCRVLYSGGNRAGWIQKKYLIQ